MGIIRLILLLAVLGGLTLLLAQNWSPALALVFLGIRTQPLPLAMWILFSTAAGAGTSLFISSLFGLSNYFGGQRQTSSKSSFTAERPNPQGREEPRTRTASPPPPSSKKESSTNAGDDWDINNTSEDWDFEQTPEEPENTEVRSNTREREQQPKNASKSDSGYSYSYREPKNSGVGKTESVYDADYRVIIPPYQPPTTTNQRNDDDWGIFDDDDDFEDGDENKRSRR